MIDVHSLSLALSPPPACPHACLLVYCQAITYAIALEFWGQNKVHQHVGFEPSGRNFNELCLDEKRRPHNPMINSGAIMAVSLCFPSLPLADVRACTSCEAHVSPLVGQDSLTKQQQQQQPQRFDKIVDYWSRLAGGTPIGFANSTYLSEAATADRNFCLAYMMVCRGTPRRHRSSFISRTVVRLPE